jgi:hypothetical protein
MPWDTKKNGDPLHVVDCTGVQEANREDQAEADRMPEMFARVSDCLPVLAIGLFIDGLIFLFGLVLYRIFVK